MDCNLVKGNNNNVRQRKFDSDSVNFPPKFWSTCEIICVLLVLRNAAPRCQNSLMTCCDKTTFCSTTARTVPVSPRILKCYTQHTSYTGQRHLQLEGQEENVPVAKAGTASQSRTKPELKHLYWTQKILLLLVPYVFLRFSFYYKLASYQDTPHLGKKTKSPVEEKPVKWIHI